ncbi:DUF1398 family protein [Shewanella mangrovisoli]|uniref:DUF1398 family protein n=1 Tax=Shewanella mangrovisoli TaxID=2864211 RepID=UPI0035BAE6B7
MNETSFSVIKTTFEASNQGTIHFGQVVSQLLTAGVESYYVDYRNGRTTYYLSDGATADFTFEKPKHQIADLFDGNAVKAAILGAQQGRIMYPEFKVLSQAAGCVAYTVWISGRHVVYMGRRGETHIERFPD